MKATCETGTDGFYVFYNGMDCNGAFPAGGCAAGPGGTLALPAGSYTLNYAAPLKQTVSANVSIANGAALKRDQKLNPAP